MCDCRRFIERSERRLEKIDSEREAAAAQLDEARSRLTRLDAQGAAARCAVAHPPQWMWPSSWKS